MSITTEAYYVSVPAAEEQAAVPASLLSSLQAAVRKHKYKIITAAVAATLIGLGIYRIVQDAKDPANPGPQGAIVLPGEG